MKYTGKVLNIYRNDLAMVGIAHANKEDAGYYERSKSWRGSNGTYAQVTETTRALIVNMVVYDYPIKGNNKKVSVDVRDMLLAKSGKQRVTEKMITNLRHLNESKKIAIEIDGDGEFIPSLIFE